MLETYEVALGAAPATETPSAIARDALRGLSRLPKTLPCKWFYDERGAALFDAICETPEYYVTRAELEILETYAPEMALLAGDGIDVVEIGSCNTRKIRLLLRHLRDPRCYVPVDVSVEHLAAAARELERDFPRLVVDPLVEDFTLLTALPQGVGGVRRTLIYFAGSTIGNFEPGTARLLLYRLARLARRPALLIGVDLKKPREALESAYDDAAGVTAAFNLNLLARLNREAGATFDLARFRHVAFWNSDQGRVEMHLESMGDQVVEVAGQSIRFEAGERIHTESSYKYSVAEFQALARAAGLLPVRCWTDLEQRFSVHMLVPGTGAIH